MKIQEIRSKIKNVDNIRKIVSSLKTMSMIKKKQAQKKYKIIKTALSILSQHMHTSLHSNNDKCRTHDESARNTKHNTNDHNLYDSDHHKCKHYKKSENLQTIHLLFVAQKKFCKDFIYQSSDYISNIKTTETDKFIVFGTQIINKISNVILKFNLSTSIENAYACTQIISKFMNDQTLNCNIKLHYYSTYDDKFITKTLINSDHLNTFKLYMAYNILMSSLETSIHENSIRAIAMSQAAENCEVMYNDAKLVHAKMRQQQVTNEVNEIIGGSNG